MKVSRIHSDAQSFNPVRYAVILTLSLMFLSGCADTKESASSCSTQLDEEKYQAVAENTACTPYERASGYMGWAGLSFSTFSQGATTNITNALGITEVLSSPSNYTSGNREKITKAICLIGSTDARETTSGSRCENYSDLAQKLITREAKHKELSMFALIGDLSYMIYGTIDNNLDGDISTARTQADGESKSDTDYFNNIQTPSDTSNFAGINNRSVIDSTKDYPTFELITSDNTYIASKEWASALTQSSAKCVEYADNYTVTPTSGTCPNSSSVTAVRPILKLDNLTDLTGGLDVTNRLALVKRRNLTVSLMIKYKEKVWNRS